MVTGGSIGSFIKPLGKNQAVAGRLADLSGDVRKAALEATGATLGRDVRPSDI